MINTKYKNPKNTGAIIGPIINFTENKEIFPIMAWSRYRYNSNFEFVPAAKYYSRKGKKSYNMMIVDLEIKYEKEYNEK